ncbi:HutD family protein [Dysgonomonas sp. PH5-37]|uniref:HutD/Ves family protein n=2 Tax=unclassified Dysgonomonas TaxID=2630389 RepID=UPI0024738F91|nr:HutD family protein [Dysgonomonas sp. PH5-37]
MRTFEYKIIRREELTTSVWSGGTTTQLAIYPPDAVYGERNFVWRVSSAKVAIEESTFTPLPGIARIIMPIEGEMDLIHEGHHRASLKPFEQDSFMGDWQTRCYGKVTDFNLMTTQGRATLNAMELHPFSEKEIPVFSIGNNEGIDGECFSEVFYFLSPTKVKLPNVNEEFSVERGDVLLLQSEYSEGQSIKVLNPLNTDTHVIQASVRHKK